ncbi:hypothetical protein JOF41_003633 [Saccharothrix coeruleofusca]|uniref:anti-sigma factor n=1 Tax=Saccharothrix coeruleofusca TaxID=33919 RepID=UPI001AE538E3|nr:anti-sigma factor [Saccharothrix coeruleofusca]MBP2337455.1 hypothetical protein [Saccharothrix coeruleofusca]
MTGERRDHRCPQEELAVGWALHALEPDEQARLAAHLPGCAHCAQVVRSTQEATAVLAGALPQHEPPPRLKTRLMAAVAETPQVRQADPAAATGPVRLDERRRRAGRTPKLLAAAAALVVIAGATAAGVRLVQLGDQITAQQARADRLETALALAADPAAKRVVLRSPSREPVAVLLSADDTAAVMPVDLEPNDANSQTYVLWGITGTAPVALATFDVGTGDSPTEVLHWSQEAYRHDGYAISLEPGREMPDEPTNVLGSGQAASA